jgi:uncharacterized protein YjiS (DUF1127 family)
MSAQTADSQSSFKLPSLTYIDAKWEEPNLRVPSATPQPKRPSGVGAWLRRPVAVLVAWRRKTKAESELAAMSDRELFDIGLIRSDLPRVFNAA